MQVVVEPLSCLNLLDSQSGLTIGQRSEVEEAPHNDSKDTAGGCPHAEQVGLTSSLTDRLVLLHSSLLVLGEGCVARGDVVDINRVNVEDEFNEGTSDECRSEMSREVVVEEELTAHDVEGDVVGSPGQEEETSRVVETVAGT